MKLQKSPIDEFGVKHLNILYNYEANIVYCLLEAPSREAVELNHAKLHCKCDWITEVKQSPNNIIASECTIDFEHLAFQLCILN